ncbi:MAG: hypothetical protein OXI79_20300 [Gammaproteobacteria bacterium]|nr:hypothetical protein [Gammaproteobacteria bacterium]
MDTKSIVRLATVFARHRGLTLSTVSNYATNDGKVIVRLANGADITSRRAARVVQWFSDRWPADLDWPAGIARPAPSPDSPAAAPEPVPDDPVAAVREANDAVDAAMQASDWDGARCHEAMDRAGMPGRRGLAEARGPCRHGRRGMELAFGTTCRRG